MPKRKTLYLASASKVRAKILTDCHFRFKAVKSGADENVGSYRSHARLATSIAASKVEKVAKKCRNQLIIGADTFAIFQNQVIGKPSSIKEAKNILTKLSGKTHTILTGLCVYDQYSKKVSMGHEKTVVTFKKIASSDLAWYFSYVNPLDKAPGYSIEREGAFLIESIKGCYFNVLGLPIVKLSNLMARIGRNLMEFKG